MNIHIESKGKKRRSLLRWIGVNALLTTLMLAFLVVCGEAQSEHRYTLSVGGGYSPLVGDISKRLDNGWHVTAGAGLNITRYLAATLDYNYNGFGVSNSVLREAKVPDGNSHMWSLTANPKLRLNRFSKVNPYIVGGVGYYRRTLEFTRPTAVPVTIFDPFFGAFFDTLIPADKVLGRITRGGPGGSLGGGFDFKFPKTSVKLFTEARYHYASTGSIPTRMVPVTLGFRW